MEYCWGRAQDKHPYLTMQHAQRCGALLTIFWKNWPCYTGGCTVLTLCCLNTSADYCGCDEVIGTCGVVSRHGDQNTYLAVCLPPGLDIYMYMCEGCGAPGKEGWCSSVRLWEGMSYKGGGVNRSHSVHVRSFIPVGVYVMNVPYICI